MNTLTIEIIEQFWKSRSSLLEKEINTTLETLDAMLEVDEHYREGRLSKDRIGMSMGRFGSEGIDTEALASIFRKADQRMTVPRERMGRISAIATELKRLKHGHLDRELKYTLTTLGNDIDEIISRFDRSIEPLVKIVALLRKAKLEIKGKYDPAKHDLFYAQFDWRNLTNNEMTMCPPFVVTAELEEVSGLVFGQMLHLVSSGKPIKLIVLQSKVTGDPGEIGRAAALKIFTDIGFLSVSLRNIYVLQSSLALEDHLRNGIIKGLSTLRPAVMSVLSDFPNCLRPLRDRAHHALVSRAFPHFVFDPDRAMDFVNCLDIDGNPELEKHWVEENLLYLDDQGKEQVIKHPFTYADFVASEGGLNGHFTKLPQNVGDTEVLPLSQYIYETHSRREGKMPFINAVDEKRHLVRLMPSKAIIAQTVDRMHLWRALQELAGVDNPFVVKVKEETSEKFRQEQEKQLLGLKSKLETEIRQREDSAVASAMKNLAMRLVGMDADGIKMTFDSASVAKLSPEPGHPVDDTVQKPAIVVESKLEKAGLPAGDAAWIDTPLCTSCDECININKNLFGYNADKKAFVKNPKGGPFKDIVKAAEKCSAGIIHPGKPQDPTEKNLDKLVARAAKYN